ncbi:MAG: 30S ribosomal protein S10 [Flavobacteriales bacterium]|nr:MAG: 30S ribosomal protein S10 [Flavobacteriales bacterium]
MKLRIFFKSFDKQKINFISQNLRKFLITKNYSVSGIIALPIKIKKFCVLRSPHVNKDSREHLEIRSYKQFMDVTTESLAIFNALLNFQIPAEVASSIKIL